MSKKGKFSDDLRSLKNHEYIDTAESFLR